MINIIFGLTALLNQCTVKTPGLNYITHKYLINVIEIYGCEKSKSLKTITIDYETNLGGMANDNNIMINGYLDEIMIEPVLVHEMAHLVNMDLSIDLKKEFRNISWNKFERPQKDFVSGYAMKNAGEDFAETATFFVYHNFDFRVLSLKSEKLKLKYEFMKKLFGKTFKQKVKSYKGLQIFYSTEV